MSVERRRMSRSRILEGAHAILDAGVYGDLTVDALARSLHMSKSTLYKYFASKDDVVVSLIDSACAVTDDALAEVDIDGAPAAALEGVAEVLAAHAERIPRAAVLQHQRLPGACQDRIQLTRATIGQALQRVIAAGAERGTFRYPTPALAATTFMAGADAAMKAAARGEVEAGRGASVRALLDLYLPGLTAGLVDA